MAPYLNWLGRCQYWLASHQLHGSPSLQTPDWKTTKDIIQKGSSPALHSIGIIIFFKGKKFIFFFVVVADDELFNESSLVIGPKISRSNLKKENKSSELFSSQTISRVCVADCHSCSDGNCKVIRQSFFFQPIISYKLEKMLAFHSTE